MSFLEPLFPAMRAKGLLLKILCGLPLDHGFLHACKNRLGFGQGYSQTRGPQRTTLQTDYVFNGFSSSAVGFDNNLHFDFHQSPPIGYTHINTSFPRA